MVVGLYIDMYIIKLYIDIRITVYQETLTKGKFDVFKNVCTVKPHPLVPGCVHNLGFSGSSSQALYNIYIYVFVQFL